MLSQSYGSLKEHSPSGMLRRISPIHQQLYAVTQRPDVEIKVGMLMPEWANTLTDDIISGQQSLKSTAIRTISDFENKKKQEKCSGHRTKMSFIKSMESVECTRQCFFWMSAQSQSYVMHSYVSFSTNFADCGMRELKNPVHNFVTGNITLYD